MLSRTLRNVVQRNISIYIILNYTDFFKKDTGNFYKNISSYFCNLYVLFEIKKVK